MTRAPALFLGLGLLLAGPVRAQQDPPPADTVEAPVVETTDPTAAKTPPAPLSIPAADIPSRAEEMSARLRLLEALLQPVGAVELIERDLSEEAQRIVLLRDELDQIDEDRVSPRRLADLRVSPGSASAPSSRCGWTM
jgi:hypothetical protein